MSPPTMAKRRSCYDYDGTLEATMRRNTTETISDMRDFSMRFAEADSDGDASLDFEECAVVARRLITLATRHMPHDTTRATLKPPTPR
jgi:hypothetical protein